MQQCLIAVIDDDPLVRSALASLIRSFGYRAALYESADAFLAAPAADAGCVLTDLQMPGRSGVELGQQLRAGGSAVPIILMTAFPTADLHGRTAALGLTAVLEKPIDPDRLAAALAAATG